MAGGHPQKFLFPAFVAGMISAGLFLLVSVLGLGFFFFFLPTLPLLVAGLNRHPRAALYGGIIASIFAGTIAGPEVAFLFFFTLGLPSWAIARSALSNHTTPLGTQWFPIGLILLQLALYACAGVALLTLYFSGEPGGISAVIGQHIRKTFAELETDYADAIDILATSWSFLVFSITVWLWGMALYAHAWFANHMLARQGKTTRPDFSVHPFIMPNWVLSLLTIAALASLIGSPSMQLLGKSTLVSLMLPYFFLGAGLMHTASRTWPSRRFFLFFTYFFMFLLFWPALFVSAAGLIHHIKRLSGGKTSSKG